jgi:gliding motility-associated protein GldM
LEPELTKYVDNANVIFTAIKKQLKEDSKGNEFSSLTLDPKEDPQYYIGRDDKAGKKGRLDDHVKGKDWSQVNFDHSPMVACLARLTDIQSKLVTIDTKVISLVKNSLGAADFKFDKLGVMANADANTVVAGTPYRAQIFLTAYSDKLQPKITVSGKNLKVVNGKGEYKRLASASGKADKDGLFTNSYVATIEVPDPLNPAEMKKFTETIKYKVAKPVIKVESGAVSALYLNCGNALNITVPALGAMYKPKFTVTKGAASITGTNGKGKVVIIPTKPGKVTIRVSSGGQTIGSQTFGVRSVPKPKFILRKSNVKGKKVNLKNGEKLPGPSTLYVQSFVDDETFKTNLPKDSKYKVVKWKVEILKGSRPLGSKTFTSPSGNIRSLLGKASDGARIYCEVQKVKRKNYQGKLLDVKIPIESFTINLSK